MMSAAPDKFYITDHYLNYPWMLVRMSKVWPDELRDLLIGSWRRAAPKDLVDATFDQAESMQLATKAKRAVRRKRRKE